MMLFGVCTANSKGDDLSTGILDGCLNELHGILTGTQNKTGMKFVTANDELVVVNHNKSFFLIRNFLKNESW